MNRIKTAIILLLLLSAVLLTGCLKGIGSDTGRSDDKTPNNSASHAGKLADGKRWFDAKVLEAGSSSITVMPFEGTFEASGALDAGLIVHVQADVKNGDYVRITYDGLIAESYPAQIFNVFSVELLDETMPDDTICAETIPATDFGLDFELTQDVKNYDFSNHEQIYGLFGGYEYLGSGYSVSTDASGRQVLPEHYVLYTITAYPDYADGGSYITAIEITDPNVDIFGFSVDDSVADFEKIFGNYYNIVRSTETFCIAECGNFTYKFEKNETGQGKLRISAEVTNRNGIIF